MADPFLYPPQTGEDTRTFIIYLTATGHIVRRVNTHPDLIEYNVNKVNAEGVGDPVITFDPNTNTFYNVYPGPGGESYVAIDPITQRDMFQASLGTLEVIDGVLKFRDTFGEFNPARVPADDIAQVVLDGLPLGTVVEFLGDLDVVSGQVTITDGNFELSSPIRQNIRLRVSHPRRITKEYVVGFL